MRKKEEPKSFFVPKEFTLIPTGVVALDQLLGIPRGHITLITGYPGSGKSTLGYSILGQALKSGLKAIYVDLESSFPAQADWAKLQGLDIEELEVWNNILLEDWVEATTDYLNAGERSCFLVDSVPGLIAREDSSYGYRARVLSDALPRFLKLMLNNDSAIIFLSQIRDNFDPTSHYPLISGGWALQHFSSLHINLVPMRYIVSSEQRVGQEIRFEIRKIKFGSHKALPRGSFFINFKEGLNPADELRDMLQKLGLAKTQNGVVKFQEQEFGPRKFLNYIRENKEAIIQLIKESVS